MGHGEILTPQCVGPVPGAGEWSHAACLCRAVSEDMCDHAILATRVSFVFRVPSPINPPVVRVLECFNPGFNSNAEVSAGTVYLLKAGDPVGWVSLYPVQCVSLLVADLSCSAGAALPGSTRAVFV